MELVEVIKKRRSIRKYQDAEVPKELIEDLVECARLAPSAKNRQPWEFVIVTSKIKNQIADMMIAKEEGPKRKNDKNSSVKGTAKIIKEAPVLILVLKPREKGWNTGDALSIGGAIEHICLRATDLGLGSLWIRDTVYVQKEIEELIGCEEKELICAISIGYPNESPVGRPKKALQEILKWHLEDE